MKKLFLTVAALALLSAPVLAAVPAQSHAHISHVVLASVHKKAHGKKHHAKHHAKKHHGKKHHAAASSKPAVDAGNTSAGEHLPPVEAPITDTSGGPQ